MPTLLLGTLVPDYPNAGQEMCHCFTCNFLLQQHAQGVVNYVMPNADSLQFLYNTLHRLGMQRNNGQIAPGNLIIIGNGRTATGGVGLVTHSMIAINQHVWFGCNNLNTFGVDFNNRQIPLDTILMRREINLQALGININYANRTFNGFTFDVFM